MSVRICHVTSAHPRGDVRIFQKQCRSLVKHGFEVFFLVADGVGDQVIDGITIYDVGKPKSRLNRMLVTPKHLYRKATTLGFDVYILHDPELLQIALPLKKQGGLVIFDSHEDVTVQILSKHYLRWPVNIIISHLYFLYERLVVKRISAVICATLAIKNKFDLIGIKAVEINNYPNLEEFGKNDYNSAKSNEVCYIGSISAIRGINEVVRSLEYTSNEILLSLCGEFDSVSTKNKVVSYEGWRRVNYFGQLSRTKLHPILNRAFAGIVTFHPVPNHLEAQPNKMFEYMACGMPLIASNFPLWNTIVRGTNCGVIVDPQSAESISAALDFLYNNPIIAEEMGRNGREAVFTRYNWEVEELKYIKFLEELIKGI